jgi:hypothetical protein
MLVNERQDQRFQVWVQVLGLGPVVLGGVKTRGILKMLLVIQSHPDPGTK